MHNAAFHLGLHCLLFERTEIHNFIEVLSSKPLKYEINNFILIVLTTCLGKFIRIKVLNLTYLESKERN